MKLHDWCALPEAIVSSLYGDERAHWLRALGWDTTSTWTTVETARASWGLPGFFCCDATGAILGWTFFMVYEDRIEVGGLVAADIGATRVLVDGLLERAGGFDRLKGFICARAAGLDDVLASRGLPAQPYLYLVSPTTSTAPHAMPAAVAGDADEPLCVRSWRDSDGGEAAQLMCRAYGAEGRLFAPHEDPAEWLEYIAQLVAHTGCGTLAPALSRLVVSGGQIRALGMVSALGAETAHLVQLAVEPSWRGRGLGRWLVTDALARARQAGYSQLSLMTSSGNLAARTLYSSLGFVEQGRFTALGVSQRAAGDQSADGSRQMAVGSRQLSGIVQGSLADR